MTGEGKLPPNWRNFLRDNDNKAELFHFLADTIVASVSTTNVGIVTKEDDDDVSNKLTNLTCFGAMQPRRS